MIKCKAVLYRDTDTYPHKLYVDDNDGAVFIQNFINALGLSSESIEIDVDNGGWKGHMWLSHEEYEALVENADVLGIELEVV